MTHTVGEAAHPAAPDERKWGELPHRHWLKFGYLDRERELDLKSSHLAL